MRRPDLWPCLIRAVWELALARRALGRQSARALLARAQDPLVRVRAPDAALPARVAWAIPRVAARLPWRTDCLVQAMAARRWLARAGIATELWIGSRTDQIPGFEAHAWLCLDGAAITGGDITGFVPLIRPTSSTAK